MFTCSERRRDTRFRVSIHDHADAFVLKLEGPFRIANTPDVEARWCTAASLIRNRPFVVDLAAATQVEPAARDLLVRMYESGAGFVAGGPAMARLVSGITGAPCREPVARKRGLWVQFRGFQTLVDCLRIRIRAWAS
jgi:hypothetical protein